MHTGLLRRKNCRAVRRFLLLLIVAAALSLPAAAQVYRVEHLPEFTPACGTVWDEAHGKPDPTQEVEVPNGAAVTLLDTLGRYDALVVYNGKKIGLSQRDLVWAPELNAADAVDRLGYRPRLSGLGHFPLHSALGRFLYSYNIAWSIAAMLLFITLMVWLPVISENMRIYLLTAGMILVLLTETVWGVLTGIDLTWFVDDGSGGFLRTVIHIAGYFALLCWQAALIKRIQTLICSQANIGPATVKLRWAVLIPVPVFFAASLLIARYLPRDGWSADTVSSLVVASLLGFVIWSMVRYYRILGRKRGVLYLALYAALLLSSVVLVPLTVGLGAVALVIIVGGFFLLWFFSNMLRSYRPDRLADRI